MDFGRKIATRLTKVIKAVGDKQRQTKHITNKPIQIKFTPPRIKTKHTYLWRFHHGDEL